MYLFQGNVASGGREMLMVREEFGLPGIGAVKSPVPVNAQPVSRLAMILV